MINQGAAAHESPPWLGGLTAFSKRRQPRVLADQNKGQRVAQQRLMIFLLLHVPLALALQRFPVLVLAHAYGVFCLGLCWALGRQRQEKVAYVAAYLAGAEVLWRMTNTSSLLPWEFGKYGLASILLLGMVRGRWFSIPMLPLSYFLLLIPAAVVTVLTLDSRAARDALSFNLSGPLALMLGVAFFSRVKLSTMAWGKLMVCLMAPILGIAALTLVHLSTTTVVFGHSSNAEASGGFGPNQVSSAMGLGVIAAFFCVLHTGHRFSLRIFCLALMLALATQSALTLSRSGLYLAGVGILGGCFYLLRDSIARRRIFLLGVVVAVVFASVFPVVNAFTDGALVTRFQDTRSTGRDRIAEADLKIFHENLLWGVGVGKAKEERRKYLGHSVVAHTEFSRMLAEHGLFGIGSIVLLVTMAVRHVGHARTAVSKAVVIAFVTYAFLFMTVNGMRLLLPSLAFGLSAIAWIPANVPVKTGRVLSSNQRSRAGLNRSDSVAS